MNRYQREKENARMQAIEYQYSFNDNCYSYDDIIIQQTKFEKLAKKYELIKEFKKNAII